LPLRPGRELGTGDVLAGVPGCALCRAGFRRLSDRPGAGGGLGAAPGGHPAQVVPADSTSGGPVLAG